MDRPNGEIIINTSSAVAKYQEQKTKTSLFKYAKPITLKIPTKDLNTGEIAIGFMANFIHSMDAANIHIALGYIGKMHSDMSIYTIHDCFATTADNVELMTNIVKDAFIYLYFDENYIINFYNQIIQQINHANLYTIKADTGEICTFTKDGTALIIPSLPKTLLDRYNRNRDVFIKGLKRSNYFIS